MKIRDLIDFLQQEDGEKRVVYPGYEGGYHELDKEDIGTIPIKFNVNDAWYYGPHEYAHGRLGDKVDEHVYTIGGMI